MSPLEDHPLFTNRLDSVPALRRNSAATDVDYSLDMLKRISQWMQKTFFRTVERS